LFLAPRRAKSDAFYESSNLLWFVFMALLAHAETGADLSEDWPTTASEQLPEADGLYLRWDSARSWGSPELCETIAAVAQRLAFEMPHADPLLVGDISQRGGGWLRGHRTHNLGVDADIGLFTADARQPLGGFMDLHPSQLDLPANWTLIRALIDQPDVAFILLDQRHIDALKGYALNEVGLSDAEVLAIFPDPSTRTRWDRVRGIVRHVPNHRSHLHVRVVGNPAS
jgi:hypothetical protein